MTKSNDETQSDMDAAHALLEIAANLRAQEPVGHIAMLPNVAEAVAHLSISTQNIAEHLSTQDETGQNLEASNVADGLFAIARGLRAVAGALSIRNALEFRCRRHGGDYQDIVNLSERLRTTKPNGEES